MYTDEQFEDLEREERSVTDESIAIMLLLISNVKGELEKELRSFYQKYGKDGVVTYREARKWVSEQDHRRRLTALLAFLSLIFSSALPKIKAEFEKMLKAVIEKEAAFFNVEIDPDEIIDLFWGVDDSTWLKRLEDDFELWQNYIAIDWQRSMLQQKDIEKVIDLLGKRFFTIESLIQTLGLTESTAIGSLARQQIFKKLGITRYRFYTRPDERRCEVCGSMHGLIFQISAYEVGSTASPIHPRCRCWEVPIVD